MKAYAKKRMRKLIDFLRNEVSRSGFDMGCWFTETPCKTVGCIGGWACTIPSFKKAGLKLKLTCSSNVGKYRDYEVTFKGETSDIALTAFFDLQWKETNELFFNCSKPVHTPKQAAHRLEKFLEQKEKETANA